jgi:integrase
MWKICTPFLASVNSRQKGEHPSGSRVNYVPAGGRNPTPPRKAIVFTRQARNKPLSNMVTEMVLRRMKTENATVHGLRSSFRDWAGNETGHPRELIETALAHVIGDKAEQAYRRSDALEKRRALMEAWAGYCDPTRLANVVKMRRR